MVKGRYITPDYNIRGRGHQAPFGVATTIRGAKFKKVEAWVSGGDYSREASDRGNVVYDIMPAVSSKYAKILFNIQNNWF